METWLLFLLRLIVVGLIGFFIYSICQQVQQPLLEALTPAAVENSNVAEPPEAAKTRNPKTDSPTSIVIAGLAFFVALVVGEVVVIRHFQAYRKFRNACGDVLELGGKLRFEPESRAWLFCYLNSETTVDLSCTSLDDERAVDFSAFPKLKILRLSGTLAGERTIKCISNCRRLQGLDLSNTSILDEHLAPLAKLPGLQNLILSGTSVTDDGLKYLANCDQLKRLECHNTGITSAGLATHGLEPIASLES